MKFYIAASWDSKEQMRKHAAQLRERGHIVTGRWLKANIESNFDSSNARHAGVTDLEDINACDTVLLFTHLPSSTGGMHVEYGYAIAKFKTVIIIGQRVNIFQRLSLHQFDDWDAFMKGFPV